MQFTASLASLATALVLALATPTVRAGLTAFNGIACDGSVGLDVPCDGSCHSFAGRHSFRVDAGSGDHCVTTFVDAGCPSQGEAFTFTGQDGQCTHVNTGTGIQSFVCAAGNSCQF